MNRFVLGLAILSVLGTARVAVAADGAADALVARGLELRREGKAAEALELFERAYSLSPSPRTVGQMGLAEASLQRWLDAEKHLNASLGVADDIWVRKNKALVEQAIELTHKHVGHITITGPAGASISVAGNAVGTLPIPAPLRVVEGTSLVTATAPGFKQLIQSVTVLGGGRVAVDLAMQRSDVPRAEPTAAPTSLVPLQRIDDPEASWCPWTAGALFAAGAAAITWGAIWIAVDGNNHGADSTGRPLVYNTKTTGWIILGAGAATAAVGGIVLLSAHRGEADLALAARPAGFELAGRF